MKTDGTGRQISAAAERFNKQRASKWAKSTKTVMGGSSGSIRGQVRRFKRSHRPEGSRSLQAEWSRGSEWVGVRAGWSMNGTLPSPFNARSFEKSWRSRRRRCNVAFAGAMSINSVYRSIGRRCRPYFRGQIRSWGQCVCVCVWPLVVLRWFVLALDGWMDGVDFGPARRVDGWAGEGMDKFVSMETAAQGGPGTRLDRVGKAKGHQWTNTHSLTHSPTQERDTNARGNKFQIQIPTRRSSTTRSLTDRRTDTSLSGWMERRRTSKQERRKKFSLSLPRRGWQTHTHAHTTYLPWPWIY